MLTKTIGSLVLFLLIATSGLVLCCAALVAAFEAGWLAALALLSFAGIVATLACSAWDRLASDWRYWRALRS